MTQPRLPTLELPACLDFLKLKNFPLRVYPAVNAPKRFENDTLYIYGPGPKGSVASFDVGCLITQIYLRFCNVHVDIVNGNEPDASPNKHLPFLVTVVGQVLAGQQIDQWIKDNEKDTPLGNEEDDAIAFMSMAQTKLHAAWLFSMWLEPLNYSTHASSFYYGHLPAPINSILASKKKDQVVEQLLTDRDVLSREEIYAQATEVLEALSVKLGDATFFYDKPQPTKLDAVVFAYLHCILSLPPADKHEATREEKAQAATLKKLVQRHENLVNYAKHIFQTYLEQK